MEPFWEDDHTTYLERHHYEPTSDDIPEGAINAWGQWTSDPAPYQAVED